MVKRVLEPQRSAQQFMLVAVSDKDPDIRREAVTRVARSKNYQDEWAIKGFIAIALLESDEQARCVAVRALGRTDDTRAIQTMLDILNYRDLPPAKVRPPGPLVRWDVADLLADQCARGMPAQFAEPARLALLARLRTDSDRNVRAAAARGLGYCPHPDSVKSLIDGLRDESFAVVHTCETALVQLTGVTHDCDALSWDTWLEQNHDDPFAHAGDVPDSRKPHYTNRWGKMVYNTRQVFTWLFPGKK